VDAEHGALQDFGALVSQESGELGFLPGFEDQDAIAVQSLDHWISRGREVKRYSAA
jgi:hypothetical protein